jgi:tetratricopeptide (TPR) repeat protein
MAFVATFLGCENKTSKQPNKQPEPIQPTLVDAQPNSNERVPLPAAEPLDVGLSQDWESFQKTDLIDEALRVMDLLVERFPDSADSHEARARVQLLIGQTAEAKKSWERCLQLVPNYGYAFHGLGLIETKMSQYKAAIALYQKALETIPNYRDSARELSDAYLKDGQPKLSAKTLEDYLAVKPDDSEFWLRLGQTYNAGLVFDKAKSAFEKSLELADDNPKAEQGLMIALIRLGDRERAKELADKAKQRPNRENDPIEELLKNERTDIANRYWFAALVYKSFKRYQESAELLERAHLYNPTNTQVLESLVEQSIREESLDQAYSYSLQLVTLNETNPSYSFGAGAMAEKLKRASDAAAHYRKVIELAPRDPKAYRQLITISLTSKSNLPEAEALAKAWSEFDNTAVPLAYLASAQAMQNKLVDAEKNLTKAVELDPNSKELQQRLVEVRNNLRTDDKD